MKSSKYFRLKSKKVKTNTMAAINNCKICISMHKSVKVRRYVSVSVYVCVVSGLHQHL